jgi:hypothetical protein
VIQQLSYLKEDWLGWDTQQSSGRSAKPVSTERPYSSQLLLLIPLPQDYIRKGSLYTHTAGGMLEAHASFKNQQLLNRRRVTPRDLNASILRMPR